MLIRDAIGRMFAGRAGHRAGGDGGGGEASPQWPFLWDPVQPWDVLTWAVHVGRSHRAPSCEVPGLGPRPANAVGTLSDSEGWRLPLCPSL
eukprot:307924-Chlamydomonas_euryale.AAC.2